MRKRNGPHRPCRENYSTIHFYSKNFAYICHAFVYGILIISFVHGNQACFWGKHTTTHHSTEFLFVYYHLIFKKYKIFNAAIHCTPFN